MKKRAVTILSGGLDSAVATSLAMTGLDIRLAVTFDYGQRAAKREISAARRLCRSWRIEHAVVKLEWLKEITHTALVDRSHEIPHVASADIERRAAATARSVWVPNRNAVFVSIAASFAESMKLDAMVAGFNAEEGRTFPDNSAKFISAANEMLRSSTLSRPKLVCPVSGMTKFAIAIEFERSALGASSFWCCYEGGRELCGLCESCTRTIRAFRKAGIFHLIERRFSD